MFKKYAPFIESRQTELLVKLTGIFWLFEKLIGWRVWTTYRLFPTAPVFTFLDAIPAQFHLVLFIAELALILWLIFFDVITPVPAILLSCEILSCLLDQNRLQPYEYQCIITLLVLIINRNNRAAIPVAIAFILAATYFYSGIGKFNQGFLKGVWEGMILGDFFKVPFRIRGLHWVYLSGYLPGFAELAAGLGLLFPRARKIAAIFLILMHVFILALIGPLGLNYNKIVWPWNVAMILYLYIIFLNKRLPVTIFNSIFWGWNTAVFVLLGVLPLLNTVGYWDNYLSCNLYSGKLPKMIIGVGDTTKCMELRPFFSKNNLYYYQGSAVIIVQNWGLKEMQTLPYPELRVLKKIAIKLEKKYPTAALTPFYFANGQMVNNY